MYKNVAIEMSLDRNGQDRIGQTESTRPKSPVPRSFIRCEKKPA